MPKNYADLRRRRAASSRGFTLIEVVVALAIAGMGLGFLMAAAGMGLNNATLAYQYVEAVRRAQSRLAQVGTVVPLRPGEESGNDGGGYGWRLQISEPVLHADARNAPGQTTLGLYTVEVTISWRSGRLSKDVSLRSQRLGPAGGGNG